LGQEQGPTNVPATSYVADTVPRDELAALIASIVEEKMNWPFTQDRQQKTLNPASHPILNPVPRLLSRSKMAASSSNNNSLKTIIILDPYQQASILLPVCIQLPTPWMSRIPPTSRLYTPTLDNHLSPAI